jgi:hypothetical protein
MACSPTHRARWPRASATAWRWRWPLAESRLAGVDAAAAGDVWDGEGEFGETYIWRVETSALEDGPPGNVRIESVVVSVTVTWDSGGPVVLETVRLRQR